VTTRVFDKASDRFGLFYIHRGCAQCSTNVFQSSSVSPHEAGEPRGDSPGTTQERISMSRCCFWIVLLFSSIAMGGSSEAHKDLRIPLVRARKGYLRNLRGTGQITLSRKNHDTKSAARKFLLGNKAFGMQDACFDLSVERTKARGRRSFVRFDQTCLGIPVFAADVAVQLAGDGRVEYVASNVLTEADLDEAFAVIGLPTILGAEAVGMVRAENPDVELWISPDLVLYDPEIVGAAGPMCLAWRVETVDEVILVNAYDGRVALRYPQQTSLLDRRIYDLHCQRSWGWGNLVKEEGNQSNCGADVDRAYAYAADAYNFFLEHHGRDGLDGEGFPIICLTNYSPDGECDYQNAFWDHQGRYLAFGSGCVYDDVMAHEYTHGITQYTSGIIYLNEPGAINEHFSDVWGEFIDQTNGRGDDSEAVKWLIGEEMVEGGLRSMKDPTTDRCPDRMGSEYWRPVTPDALDQDHDYGRVHYHNGVGNKLCYLLTDGDTFNGYTIEGMGIDAVAELYYEVQTGLLTKAPNYTDLCFALLQAADNLGWTSHQKANLEKACQAVEIASYACKYQATDGPKPISSGTVESPINVDESRIISDLNVKLDLAHGSVSDLSISLVSPRHTTVLLFDGNAEYASGYGYGFYGTTFDDQAPFTIEQGCEPFTGTFRPLEPLNAFNGEDAEGVWALKIEDHLDLGHGQLIGWSLELQ